MWQNILDLAIKNGLWAVLFLGLLIYVLKDSNKREKKYQQTIKDLTEHLGIVHDIKKEVEQVKEIVFSKNKSKKSSNSQSSSENNIM